MDLNIGLLKRSVEYYEEIKQLNENIFLVEYKPTKDSFALRKNNLKEFKDLEIYENEINLTNRLKHKNLLPYLTSFVSETYLWTIAPYAEFRSLADLSVPFGLNESAISLAMKDVLEAVHYLHNNCIIHNSIRASHILLYGRPETEFRCILSGLKYSINTIQKGKIKTSVFNYPIRTESNYNWLAPEVLEQNILGFDTKADIYSIGITCCELSNGSVPFDRYETAEVLLLKLNNEIPEPLDSESKDIKELIAIAYDSVGLKDDMKLKYEFYLAKKFSPEFKKFTNSCLHSESEKRPNALQLESHSFISKYENLDKIEVFLHSIRKNLISKENRVPKDIIKFL